MLTESTARAASRTYGPLSAPETGAASARPRRLIHFGPSMEGRSAVEKFIRREFIAHFDARPRELMPQLVAVHDRTGAVTGAAGYRSAAQSKLFLETYTQQPIEAVIATRFGEQVERERIAEVGNLATRGGRSALQLVSGLLPELIERNFSWVVFTGAQAVRNLFQRLHLLPYAICVADKTLLGDERHAWGTYYDHNPIVMAGRLRDGISALQATAALVAGNLNRRIAQDAAANEGVK